MERGVWTFRSWSSQRSYIALMASSSRSGNALKNFATFTAARRLRGAWGEWESLMAWTNASLLCARDELASGSEDRVSGVGENGIDVRRNLWVARVAQRGQRALRLGALVRLYWEA